MHAPGERLVARLGLERVGPDHPVCGAPEPRHLVGQDIGNAAIPSVREYDHNGTPAEPAAVGGGGSRPDRRAPGRRAAAGGLTCVSVAPR